MDGAGRGVGGFDRKLSRTPAGAWLGLAGNVIKSPRNQETVDWKMLRHHSEGSVRSKMRSVKGTGS